MKQKGFTLVELLAVIVILAVIALIATPVILSMIESSRKGAAESSMLSYVDAVEKTIVTKMMTSNSSVDYDQTYLVKGLTLTSDTKPCMNESSKILEDAKGENGACGTGQIVNPRFVQFNIDLKGDQPTSDNNTMKVRQNIVSYAQLKFGTYYVSYRFDKEMGKAVYCSSQKGYLAECEGESIDVIYQESLLNGADPVLTGDLIPVEIASDGTVTYADITNSWYSYEKKKWANAVILKENSKLYHVNDNIDLKDIESYFVWIPRYRYKIFNEGNYTTVTEIDTSKKTIEVVFESKNAKISNGSTVGNYLTHPAFTTFNTNGIWVGKFETTGSTSGITVRPGESSLRSLTVKDMFNLGYHYDRSLESHMMKNTEWGAVTYLTYSKYGINNRVRINNNSDRLTGYAKTVEPTCGWTDSNEECNKYGNTSDLTQPYNTSTGYLASTTGNINGIYDMSGGSHEYMASYMSGQLGSSDFSTSDLIGKEKYFDVYSASSSVTAYKYRILGDATGELGPFGRLISTGSKGDKGANISSFYSGNSHFVDASHPWFFRGGGFDHGVIAGPSYFYRNTGGANSYFSFRLVLAD